MSLGFQQLRLENGYEMESTFWNDFTIADRFGINAVKDTFNRAFKNWKENAVYLTELVIVLNHKIWQYYQSNERLARVYNELWEKADFYACENLTGDDLSFFYRITD